MDFSESLLRIRFFPSWSRGCRSVLWEQLTECNKQTAHISATKGMKCNNMHASNMRLLMKDRSKGTFDAIQTHVRHKLLRSFWVPWWPIYFWGPKRVNVCMHACGKKVIFPSWTLKSGSTGLEWAFVVQEVGFSQQFGTRSAHPQFVKANVVRSLIRTKDNLSTTTDFEVEGIGCILEENRYDASSARN